jgi:phosphonopyruvate decarboxylase
MLDVVSFGNDLISLGYDFYAGVPCSFLSNLINFAINNCDYIAANNEGDAVAIAAGAYLGGRKSVVLMQNSGLTNASNPLTSLTYTFNIPVLGFVGLRGEPGTADQPQHDLMGRITTKMLDSLEISWEYLSTDIDEARQQLQLADKCVRQNISFFFVVKKDTFSEVTLKRNEFCTNPNEFKQAKCQPEQMPSRLETLKTINSVRDNKTIILATTGKTGRELYEIKDLENNLYMVGSLGCVGSLGLGLALAKPQFPVIAIDGDGGLLMRLGLLVTNAYYRPQNLLHILLDNNSHDSTGGQATLSGNVDFIELVAAAGYKRVIYVHNLQELIKEIQNWYDSPELTFLYMKISKGSKANLSRPGIQPPEVKERLMRFLNG